MQKQSYINIKNKKARYQYELLDFYTAGIQLAGTEIKSIRANKVNFVDSYCKFFNGELWLIGLHISEYFWGTYNNHVPTRERKLLLNKKELRKLERKLQDKGLTIVPVRLFVNDRNLAKLEISLARGKKLYDKRESLKQQDATMEMKRINKRDFQ